MAVAVKHVFGRAITYRTTLQVDGEDTTAYELVSARLYDEEPTAEQIADAGSASTGHIERVLSWTVVNDEGTGPKEYKTTFAAVSDPDPNSTERYETYFVVMNFRFADGGPVMTNVEQIWIYRPDSSSGKIRVKASDVFALDRALENVMDRIDVEALIDAAIEDIVSRLEARGYEKARVFRWEKLNPATRRLALAYCCFALRTDEWLEKGRMWKEMADLMVDTAKVGFDVGGDDRPSEENKISSGVVGFRR